VQAEHNIAPPSFIRCIHATSSGWRPIGQLSSTAIVGTITISVCATSPTPRWIVIGRPLPAATVIGAVPTISTAKGGVAGTEAWKCATTGKAVSTS